MKPLTLFRSLVLCLAAGIPCATASPAPAVMTASIGTSASKYNVMSGETYATFTFSATVYTKAVVKTETSGTSFLIQEKMNAAKLNNKSVIDQMMKGGKLAAGSWTLAWIIPGNGINPATGALWAVNSGGQRVAVTAPYLEVKLQPTQVVAAETSSGKIPSDGKTSKSSTAGYVPATVKYSQIPSAGILSFKSDLKNLVISGSSIATYVSTLSGPTAGASTQVAP